MKPKQIVIDIDNCAYCIGFLFGYLAKLIGDKI